jgi:hypothetical protein
MKIVVSDSPFTLESSSSNYSTFSTTGWPNLITMGIPISDLKVVDPNYPSRDAKYAIVRLFGGVSTNGAQESIVKTSVIVAEINDENTELIVGNTKYTKANVGENTYDENDGIYYVKLNKGKLAHGLEVVEEAGSGAWGGVQILGYLINSHIML